MSKLRELKATFQAVGRLIEYQCSNFRNVLQFKMCDSVSLLAVVNTANKQS